MRIVFIGAGNLATNLAVALKNSGHEIVQVYSRTIESAKLLASAVGTEATCNIDSLASDADAYIIAVKDSVISEVISKVCPLSSNAVFMHTSGSTPVDVFSGHATHYGVLYPLQTFSRERIVDFQHIPCFLEFNDGYSRSVITQLAESVSDKVMNLSSEDRRHIHLSAVFACNFVNHCYALGADVLKKKGISFDALLPLIDETARKVHHLSPKEAQTGPAIRFDENIINRHKAMLDEGSMSKEIYDLMSKSIHLKAQEND